MNGVWLDFFVILSGIAITSYLVWRLELYRETDGYRQSQKPLVKLLKYEEKLILKGKESILGLIKIKEFKFSNWGALIEIILIGLWACWVGRGYLNLDPLVIPNGREFSSAIQSHHLWSRFWECGLCFLWNGSIRGGYPAFADIYGSMLHPLVIATTTLFGVVNGAKISIVISLWVAGIAQWWISKELDLRRLPRLWASGMVIVAGHLTGKLELGVFGLLLSTAMASLVFGAILAVAKGKGNRAIVLLGLTLASAMLAGQGYIQVGLMGTFPAVLILVLDHKFQLKKTWKHFVLAFILAGLLSAILLVPFLHFSPNFQKFTDPEFSAAQPLRYIPLNYVIDSYEFYHSGALGKLPFPYLYILFIGWIPVILALYGLTSKRTPRSIKWYFIICIGLLLGISTGDLLRLLSKVWEGAAGIRQPTLIAGLTIPLILGFAGMGLEKILSLDWPKLDLKFKEGTSLEFPPIPTQLLLVIPLLFSIYQGYQFSEHWLGTIRLNDDILQVIDKLKTDSLEWVETPYGDHLYIEPAVREGLKISPGIMAWQWKGREFPEPYFEASHSGKPAGTSDIKTTINTTAIYIHPEVDYAVVRDEFGTTPCQASGTAGNIQVICNAPRNGRLVIQENYWTGWKAKLDGKPVSVFGYPWISVEFPAGQHIVKFRYRPWDVPLGFALSLVGLILCLFIWCTSRPVTEYSIRKIFNKK